MALHRAGTSVILLVSAVVCGGCWKSFSRSAAPDGGEPDGGGCVTQEDCEDGDPCTVDVCETDGTCSSGPLATTTVVGLGEALDVGPDVPFMASGTSGVIYISTRYYGDLERWWSLSRVDLATNLVETYSTGNMESISAMAVKTDGLAVVVAYNDWIEEDRPPGFHLFIANGWEDRVIVSLMEDTEHTGVGSFHSTPYGWLLTFWSPDGLSLLTVDDEGVPISDPILLTLTPSLGSAYDQVWVQDTLLIATGNGIDAFTETGALVGSLSHDSPCVDSEHPDRDPHSVILGCTDGRCEMALQCTEPDGAFRLYVTRVDPMGMTLGPMVLVAERDRDSGTTPDSIKLSLVHGATILSWYSPSTETPNNTCIVSGEGSILTCMTPEREYSSMFLEAEGSSLLEISRSGMPIDTRVQRVCVPGISM